MQTHEIRRRFLDHFVKAGHTEVPSASLILADPNLLFVNAGMVPFVPYFLGQQTPPYTRATSVQKCVRTLDIEEVGKTTRHNTFFQMAGNFSFGDYFKEEAITFAWSLLTGSVEDGGYGIDPEKLWATVYLDDDEAFGIWRDKVGVPEERIQRRGMKDNYWSMGIPGPCGPCSEIFYDRGPDYGVEGGPEADEDRYIEIWNLVFMQNERGEGGAKDDYPILGPLPKKNIDTGMGVERVAFLLQGVENVYETDLLRPVIDKAAELTGAVYGAKHDDDVRFRVIADHARTAAMLIVDGVNPGNDGRGYVLRRLLRRIVRSARLLGADKPTMREFMAVVRDTMAPSYPELDTDFSRIETVAVGEETAFLKTLGTGSKLFEGAVETVKSQGKNVLGGTEAFTLHDTYGFPIDLTLEMAAEAGLTVDEEGFRSLMAEQRQRAKDDARARKHAHADLTVYKELLDRGPTEFTGFSELVTEAHVLAVITGGERLHAASAGQQVELILDRSPLYAESGGQIADIGTITGPGLKIKVDDVQKIAKQLWTHKVTVLEGQVVEGDAVLVQVDPEWRKGATQGHSGTHLVHAALREVLGPNAVQAGSLNKPGYLRFDFSWPGALSEQQKQDIEAVTNEAVAANYPVNTFVTDLDKAKKMGAMALFGENYGDEVRVVEIGGPFSMELCGGTHVQHSSHVGTVTLLGEQSVGSGIRRVEAYVGLDSYRHLAKERALLAGLSSTLRVPSEEVPGRVEALLDRLKAAEKELEKTRAANVAAAAGTYAGKAQRVGDVLVVAEAAPEGVVGNDLRTLASDVRGRLGTEPAVVLLLGNADGKVPFVVATSKAAQEKGIKAGDLVASFGPAIGGRGGGKPDMAQGAGSDPAGIPAALDAFRARLSELAG
ncbi:alanine--tRNA ligase [Rhodococcus rhodochrous]|uniref:alanine--tRNA ligase n=1 Tax=Rhodococcus rhodochrous TaxID=1829 RepID=UPI001E3F069D|nr:alanine--tRNA ligase [Rhodococcus rhodochrous]MCB8911815.1 alanine--tRNA ligase [Rhodococcus rhodochrous]MCD2095750.1 alanine--tRNA ligase [Rhodococcus rhodochrous]MCD2119816.1 alanine--tRNA ligase [Rhodococcus rhodochrous]MCQ4134857.1 alanine--tRNA ligase [Rhodococcus rhodochrous]MDJ0016680.1 alanine--tRNA ligase [Rhodococcus rhodochrous]